MGRRGGYFGGTDSPSGRPGTGYAEGPSKGVKPQQGEGGMRWERLMRKKLKGRKKYEKRYKLDDGPQ